MHHIVIMKKRWGLIPKIVNGEKTIESRWYKNKVVPWNKITVGDKLFFKDSGDFVKVCALSQSSVESLGFVEPYEPVFARIKNTVSKMYVL